MWYDTKLSEDLCPGNGGSKVLQNVSVLPQYYTASQPGIPRLALILLHSEVHSELIN